VIPGVVRNADAYTNLGLMSAGGQPTVKVTLLSARDSSVRGTPRQFVLTGRQSIIVGDVLQLLDPTATAGTLQIEVDSAVWAFGSIIDRGTRDPEYVPAILLN